MTTTTIALFSLLLACGDKDGDDTGHTGHTGHDGGMTDGGMTDGGMTDGGMTDGGMTDGGQSDGGQTDGGTADGGTADGGTADGGTSDGGTADGGTSDGGTAAPLEIAGSWNDNWGGDHVINDTTWTSSGGASIHHISVYDNAERYLIAQNDAANEWSPELWSRFDWTWDSSSQLWYCQTGYAEKSEKAALALMPPDDREPSKRGCNGFSWSSLTAAE